MAAGFQELFLEQGADYNTTIALDNVDGTAYDLTNFVGKSQIRKSYYSSNVSAEFVVSVSDPLDGVISLSLDSANTATIQPGRYVYDVVIKNVDNVITRVLEGTVNVLPQVTRF